MELKNCMYFQASWIRGYAANNSRALMRRRSSDALYVRMCLDTSVNSGSSSWCPGCDISSHSSRRDSTNWAEADRRGSAMERLRLDCELVTSNRQREPQRSPVGPPASAADQPDEIYLPMDCGRRYSAGLKGQL